MTRLLLIILLFLSSGPAYAEWVLVGSSEVSGGYIVYADRDTIRRKGNLVKMWYLVDHKTVQTTSGGVSYLSSKILDEYDCAEERHRLLAFTDFSGNMASSNVIQSDSQDGSKWKPVEPKSTGHALWEVACGKQ